jgi:hypothetical protein
MYVRAVVILTTATAMQRSRQQTEQLLQQLRQAGLMEQVEYRYLLPLAQMGEFYNKADLLRSANAWWMQHQQPLVVDPVLQQLGLLSPQAAQQLRHSWAGRWVVDPIDALTAVKGARLYSRRDYPTSLGPYVEQLHRDVAALLPGFTFTHFSYEVLPSAAGNGFAKPPTILVQMQVGSRLYTQRSDLQMDFGQPNAPWSRLPAGSFVSTEQFYQLFNRVLTDQGASYRLGCMPAAEGERTQDVRGRFGLIRLSTAQFRVLDTIPATALAASAAQSFRLLPTDTVLAAIRTFAAVGFFRQLTPKQRQEGERQALRLHHSSREDVLAYFPGSVGVYEGWPKYKSWSYNRLLHLLSQLSAGRFVPQHVVDNCQRSDGYLRFSIGSRQYQTALYQANESPDPRLFKLVQRALNDQDIAGKFYQVRADLGQGQGGVAQGYVFLLPTTEKRIRKQDLLTLTDPALSVTEQMALEEAASR